MPTLLQLFRPENNNLQRIFRIPDYQRGYAWGNKQLEEFWQDLRAHMGQMPRQQYIGVLTLDKIDPDTALIQLGNADANAGACIKNHQREGFFVVDGQQRLTTTLIFIAKIVAALNRFDEEAATELRAQLRDYFICSDNPEILHFSYQQVADGNPVLHSIFLGNNLPNQSMSISMSIYMHNLLKASEFFEKKLLGIELNELQFYAEHVTDRFKFQEYVLEDNNEKFVIFECLNNRGKKLSLLELLKNRLLYLSYLVGAIDLQLGNCVNTAWAHVYKHLGMLKGEDGLDDTFLRDHWIMRNGRKRGVTDAMEKELLEIEFVIPINLNHGNKQTITQTIINPIKSFCVNLKQSIEWWHVLQDPARFQNLTPEVSKWLSRIKLQDNTVARPLLMAMLLRCPPNRFEELCCQLDRYIFLSKMFRSTRHTTLQDFLHREAHQLFTADQEDLKNVVTTIVNKLRNLDSNSYISSGRILQDFTEFIFGRKSLESSKPGYYGLNGIQYLLWRYEDVLANLQGNYVRINMQYVQDRGIKSIEHILPQNPNQREWQEYTALAEEQRVRLTHSLGNLLLIIQDRNRQLSNRPYLEKRGDENGNNGEICYFRGGYSERQVADENPTDWTQTGILKRGIKLLEFVETEWGVLLGNRRKKVELLGLQFLIDHLDENQANDLLGVDQRLKNGLVDFVRVQGRLQTEASIVALNNLVTNYMGEHVVPEGVEGIRYENVILAIMRGNVAAIVAAMDVMFPINPIVDVPIPENGGPREGAEQQNQGFTLTVDGDAELETIASRRRLFHKVNQGFTLTVDGDAELETIASRRRLFHKVIKLLVERGCTPPNITFLLSYQRMFLKFTSIGQTEDTVREAILMQNPKDRYPLRRYDWHQEYWITWENSIYILRNNGSRRYIPRLVDLGNQNGITWAPIY